MTMVERVSRALWPDRWATHDGTKENSPDYWEMPTQVEDRRRLLERGRIAIAAMREPTEAMCHAGFFNADHSIEGVGDLAPEPESQPRLIYQAMIDAALEEK